MENFDIGDILRILFFLGVVIWYIFSSLSKAKKNQSEKQTQDETIYTADGKKLKKKETLSEGGYREANENVEEKDKSVFDQWKKILDIPDLEWESEPVEVKPKKKKVKPVENLPKKEVVSKIKKPKQKTGYKCSFLEEVRQFDNTNQLKKAIIYSEIIGPPKAFRD